MIIKLNNKSNLGPIFGSREVERVTNDRMYDDDDKEWILYYKKGNPVAFVSVKGNVIKNIWGYDDECIVKVLADIKKDVRESIVTKHYKELYVKAGYKIVGEHSIHFIKIRGGYNE